MYGWYTIKHENVPFSEEKLSEGDGRKPTRGFPTILVCASRMFSIGGKPLVGFRWEEKCLVRLI